MNNTPLTYFGRINQINIKVAIDKFDTEELINFIATHIHLFLNDKDMIYLSRELVKINSKLARKLSGVTEPKSIRFDFFECYALTVVFELASITNIGQPGTLQAEYPQAMRVLNSIWQNIPVNLLNNKFKN